MLIFAASEGHTAIVKLLLEEGANPDIQNNIGWTVLIFAASKGHTAIVKLLLEHGADPNIQEEDGWTALIWAASKGNMAMVQALLQHNAKADIQEKDGWTALRLARSNGHTEVAALLALYENGNTPLMVAVLQNNVDRVDQLLQDGVNLNVRNNDGKTALILAAEKGHVPIVTSLIKAEAELNILDNKRWTALKWARQGKTPGHASIVGLLLDAGAKEYGWRKMAQNVRNVFSTTAATTQRLARVGAGAAL